MKNNYHIISILGKGAFSVVYKVKSLIDDKIYCMKKIQLKENEQIEDNNEVKIILNFFQKENPNSISKHIVKYYSYFCESIYLYIIMEYCEYGDLFSLLQTFKKRKLFLKESFLWDITYQCLLSLKYLHSKNIIHRDIKLLNIFMTKDKIIKIGDFGMSKIIENESELLDLNHVGTPLYLPPEIIKKDNYDFKIDIWSLGCSLYELANLNPPFHDENLEKLGNKIMYDEENPLSNIYSQNLKSLIKAMLVKDKKKRISINESINQFIPESVIEKYNQKLNIHHQESKVTFNVKNKNFQMYNEYRKNININVSEKIKDKNHYLKGGRQIYKFLRKKEFNENSFRKQFFPTIYQGRTCNLNGDSEFKDSISKEITLIRDEKKETTENKEEKQLPCLSYRKERDLFLNKNSFIYHNHSKSFKPGINKYMILKSHNKALTIYDL